MSKQDAISQQYQRRFAANAEYRDLVWRAINSAILSRYVAEDATVLDLGCGWGEFIRNIDAGSRHAMDLNPDSGPMLGPHINFLQQDCSEPWSLEDDSLDVVFTSNFLEHLSTKSKIEDTLDQARRCLKPGG
ncbi:MAG: ubiquinone/menaquinone biosynthesis C-methylase UbiE, partial [Halieaceae bacterium]